jgi:Uma2 family endonuclease
MSIVDVPAVPRLDAESAGISMSLEEFDAVNDFDEGHNFELIHGVLVVSPFATEAERSPNELLGYWLNRYRFESPNGSILVETLFEQYVKTAENRRRADRVIWTVTRNKRPDPKIDLPSIVVEFVSAGKRAWRRDYCEKRDEYLSTGVLEYWVIDRFSRLLTAYTMTDGKCFERVLAETEVYQTDLLPGFELPLADLLAAADQWST